MAETTHPPEGAAPARPRLRKVRAVANLASGSVGRDPEARLQAIFSEHGLEAEIAAVPPDEVEAALRRAVDDAPDLLVLIAGDGTARFAGQLCGPEGPLLAPLAGGTMNMLPHALYGPRPWAEALADLLGDGEARDVSGGEVGGKPFYVAAILGSPALWAPAREALRSGKLRLAVLRARRALKRAFSGRLRFELDGGGRRKAEALTLMCPLVSRGEVGDDALEACVLDPRGAGEAFRLGARTLLAGESGAWRADPSVTVEPCREGRAWARGRIAAVLDGEPHRFDPDVPIRFTPVAFRALAPPAGRVDGGREARRAEGGAALGAAAGGAAKDAA